MTPRGFAKGEQGHAVRGSADVVSSIAGMGSRLAGLFLLASGLSACAMGSMGAMMGGSADGVAALSASSGAQSTAVVVETAAHEEFAAMAEIIETPVWVALGPLEDESAGRFSFGSVVGILLTGADDDNAPAPATPADDAVRYVQSLDSIFEDRNEVAVAMAVDLFRKNSETRRFLGAARQVIDNHARPIPAVNAAFQAGEIEAAAYRAELSQLDGDRRVLSRVVASLMEQRRTFARARAFLVADDAMINLSRMDEELATLAQYEEMVARLSGTISGEISVGS